MSKESAKCQSTLMQVVWLCVICCFFLVANVIAQAGQEEALSVKQEEASSRIGLALTDDGETNNLSATGGEDTTSGSPNWVPPSAPPDRFDWIQLTSDEWLKGDLKVLYEDKLEFDSDELGLLEFDWEDVNQVRGHQLHSVRFEGLTPVVGILKVTGNKVIVTIGEETKEFERSRLVSIAHGEPKESYYWSSKITFGFNIRKGNTDEVEYSTMANVKRRTAESRIVLDYLGNFNETEGVETSNNHRISSYYDVFHTREYFWRPVFGEYFRDEFENIAHRATVGAGIGYHIIDTSKKEWDVTAGLAYQYLRNVSVESGQDLTNSTPALVVGTEYDAELNKMVDLGVTYRFQIVNQEAGSYTHHAITTLEIEMTRRLDFVVSFVWDRIQDPKREADGRVPEKDDFRLMVGIGFEY